MTTSRHWLAVQLIAHGKGVRLDLVVSDYPVGQLTNETPTHLGQVWGPDCIAMYNTPLLRMIDGIRGYMSLDILAHKLVLGLPWYGCDYPCVKLTDNNVCEIPRAEYHGAPCSDLVDSQKNIDEILGLLDKSTDGRKWDLDGKAPQFNYKNATEHTHQVHYDDPQSLFLRYLYAVSVDLRGVGFWHVGCVTDMDAPKRSAFRKQMWDLVPDSKTWDTYVKDNKPTG